MVERERGVSSYEQLRRLQAVSDAALAHLSLDALLDELLIRIRDALDADTSAILLLDEEKNELVARAAKGLEEGVERGVRIPVGRGFAGRVAAERRPVALEDVDYADVLNPVLREKRSNRFSARRCSRAIEFWGSFTSARSHHGVSRPRTPTCSSSSRSARRSRSSGRSSTKSCSCSTGSSASFSSPRLTSCARLQA
jgi:hypothetical protein